MAKTANLLVDGYGAPPRVGLLLPLHWQSVILLLSGVAAGSTVVVADAADDLVGCDLCACRGDRYATVAATGTGDVLVLPDHPLGLPGAVPPGAADFAREVPGHGDHWTGPLAAATDIRASGQAVAAARGLALGTGDRVLLQGRFADPELLGTGLLGPLAAGAAVVLLTGDHPDPAATAAAEGVTATWGVGVAGVRRLDGQGGSP